MPQYQGVWTLEQQAQAQSNQQWVTDPNFKNTTLLLQADGTGSGSQNNTFLDGSTNNFFITRNGNTTQGSFSPFSQAPGSWSNYFNGSSTISFGSSSALNILAYDTFECWVNMPVIGTNDLIAGKDGNFWMGYNFNGIGGASNKFVFSIWNGSAWQAVSSTTTPVVGTWYHLLGVKDNTTMRFYVNGVQENTSTFSGSPVTTGTFYVASNNNVENFEGYISNLRLITGASNTIFPYSGLTTGGSFTPPTSALTAVTGTALLTCQSNRFVDNSSNNFSATITSIPSVQAFGPFAPALQWTPTVVGGSGYFDGTGDYLSIANNTAFDITQGDFLIEAWVYRSVAGVEHNIIGQRNVGNGYLFRINSNNTVSFSYVSVVGVTSTGTIPAQTWVYLAASRVGTNMRLFINGVIDGSTTSATNGLTSTGTLNIGADSTPANYMNGYLSSIRLVKGSGVSSISVPTAPANPTGTNVCLNFTNAGIYDGKMNTSWETVNSTQVSTNPVKNGSGSVYFNGTASQRLLPSQLYPQLTPGTGDFTIECWLYIIGKNATTGAGIIDYRPGVNGTYINWVVDFGGYGVGSTTAPKLVLYADSAVFISSNVISMGQWNHVALCRANSVTRMFINGVLASTPTADTKNYASGGSAGNYRPSIGSTDGGDSLYGYIDDFRISRFARYISNFTPPQQALPRQ